MGKRKRALQIKIHKGFVGLGQLFQQGFAPGGGEGGFLLCKRRAVHGLPLICLIKGKGLLVHKIEHSAEVFALTHGNGEGHRIGLQALSHGFEHGLKIRAKAVNLVDKGYLGHAKVF